nr:MAG TPA: hypothetical protein [Caudoviricetes sp.]
MTAGFSILSQRFYGFALSVLSSLYLHRNAIFATQIGHEMDTKWTRNLLLQSLSRRRSAAAVHLNPSFCAKRMKLRMKLRMDQGQFIPILQPHKIFYLFCNSFLTHHALRGIISM